jgi:hypothetical protein
VLKSEGIAEGMVQPSLQDVDNLHGTRWSESVARTTRRGCIARTWLGRTKSALRVPATAALRSFDADRRARLDTGRMTESEGSEAAIDVEG